MPAPTISPLPAPPSRSTDPANFAIEADAFVAALPAFGTQANAQASYLDGLASSIDADAVAAAASASNAAVSANDAAASAANASFAADVTRWVSGTTYVIGACVFSPIDFQTYRRTTNGAGATDPSADATNWVALGGASGGNIIKAIASGTLSDGSEVILNSDGTVSAVGSTITQLATPTISPSGGGFSASAPQGLSAAMHPRKNLIAVVYSTGSVIYLHIGEVLGDKIFFGTQVYIAGGDLSYSSVAFNDITDEIIVCHVSNSDNYLYCMAVRYYLNDGKYTGATSSNIVVRSATSGVNDVNILPNTNKFVISYLAGSTNGTMTSVVGTLNFGNPTFGTPVTLTGNGATAGVLTSCSIGGERFAVVFRSFTTTGIYAVAGQVSGTSITFGTIINTSGIGTTQIDSACDIDNQRIVYTFVNGSNSNNLAQIININGTTLTSGNSVVIATVAPARMAVSYDAFAKNFVFNYANGSDSSRQYMRAATVTATTITPSNAVMVNSDTSVGFVFNGFAPASGRLCGFGVYGSSFRMQQFTTATVVTNLASGNYIGISSGPYTNGQEAKVQIIGAVDDAQSGLIAGRAYYVTTDGTLKLTPEPWGPTVFAGTAINATKLLIKG
jgi:hypothetical protein